MNMIIKTMRNATQLLGVLAGVVGVCTVGVCSDFDASSKERQSDALCKLNPKVTLSSVAPSGVVSLWRDGVIGDFFVDNMILRTKESPECVATIRSALKGRSRAGAMTVASASLPGPFVVNPGSTRQYEGFPGAPPFIFPKGGSIPVEVKWDGVGIIMPPLPPTVLWSAAYAAPLEILTPVAPPAGEELVIPSSEPLRVAWVPPKTATANADGSSPKVIVALWFIAGSTREGAVRCGFPVTARRGSIPESLLRAVKLQVDPDNPISSANLRIVLGDRKEVVIDGSSYLIELGDFDSTTFEEKQVTLD